MNADLVIKNGMVVNSRSIYHANVYIKNGKVIAVTENPLAVNTQETIDARGLYLIPGVVDPHVHMMDPGYTDREDFITGSSAAASGGVTTVIEHHRTEPPVTSAKELVDKINYLKDRSLIDFCLMGGGTPDNVDKLEGMWQRGVTSFKMFTCSLHHQPAMSAANLLENFRQLAKLKATALVHCEDDSLTTLGEEFLKRDKRTDYLSHFEWRSHLAEDIAVETVIRVAMETGATVVIAHVSSPHLLQRIRTARDEGYQIFAETCPHYFNLSTEDLALRGPWVKFAPSVREPDLVSKMWSRLNAGDVSYIGSDHCPFPKAVKKAGEENIWEAPNGIPGVETSLRLMLNGVNQGLTTINRLVETMCENPAKIYGIYPKKGTIEVGADADIVLVDMEKEEIISNKRIVSKCGWTPYEGKNIKGTPRIVILRGQIIVREGEILGKPGIGRFVKRQL